MRSVKDDDYSSCSEEELLSLISYKRDKLEEIELSKRELEKELRGLWGVYLKKQEGDYGRD